MGKKTCLVLGGGSDIGGAIVRKLHDDGYFVYSTYFNSEKEALKLPGRHIKCDLTDINQVAELFMGDEFEAPDLMITSAFPFIEGDNFDFNKYVEVEKFLGGHVFAMTCASQRMAHGGKIVNILGQCVERGLPGGAFYSAAFAFLNNYGNSINAREGKTGKLQVCSLLLGPVDTREWSGLSPEIVDRYKAKVIDFIKPQQVAETVAFLCSQPIFPSTFKLDAYYGL
jgi:NAD(P)-dependent dehydrogenase (short-subunit alcohol dehydrogenase family)